MSAQFAGAATTAALVFALFGSGCSSSGGGEPPGFHIAYQTLVPEGGVAPALHSVKGSGPGNGWAVGEQGTAVQLKDGKWNAIASGSTATLTGLSAIGGTAFAVELASGRVLAWDGRAWSPLGTDAVARTATWASSTKDVWAVGDGIEHWDGQVWSQDVPGGAGAFTSIAGSFPTDVWAVGAPGVRRFDGTAWQVVVAPTTAVLSAVWAANPREAWIVGAQGTVLLWNGSSLTLLESGTTKDLTAVSGTGFGDVWIGGQDGVLIHWNGGWSRTVTPTGKTIKDVWTVFGAGVFIVDTSGAIIRYVP